jgi:hypothetical protein
VALYFLNPVIQYGVKNIYSEKRVEKLHLNLKKEMLANYWFTKKITSTHHKQPVQLCLQRR